MKEAEFYKKKLKNGLTVLFEKRSLPIVSCSASVKWGAAYETEENKGISHFIEHLLFKGTKKRSQKEIATEIEKKGGILNAFTSEEITSFWNKIPSKHLATGVDIVSDLILNPKFDAAEFEKEKQVIIEEIKMYHDNPRLYSPDKIKELLYKKPFGMSVAGKAEIIRALTRQQVIDIFKTNYTTDSMILCVVGDADFSDVCEMAEKIYPQTKRQAVEHVPIKKNSEAVEKRKGIDQAHFVFGFHAPAMQQAERYNYEVAGAWLFDGMSSRLFQEIREKRGLAYAVKGTFDIGKDYGYCIIYVGTMKDKIKMVKEIILKEIKELKNIKQRDFDETKEQLIGNWNLLQEDSTSVMNALLIEESAGEAEEFYKYGERINSVKIQDIRKIANLKTYSSFSLLPE